jgi:hypothetical protein
VERDECAGRLTERAGGRRRPVRTAIKGRGRRIAGDLEERSTFLASHRVNAAAM